MSTRKNLQEKVNDIGKVFSIQKVLDLKVDKKYIQKYYQANKLAYSIFHISHKNRPDLYGHKP